MKVWIKDNVQMKTQAIKPDRIRRSRRKTIALIVEQDGTLEVRAPQRMTDKQIMDFVQSKGSWIRKRQEAVRAGPPPHAYEQGEEFLYLGKMVSAASCCKSAEGGAIQRESRLTLGLQLRLMQQRWIEGWYRYQAREYLTDDLSIMRGYLDLCMRVCGSTVRGRAGVLAMRSARV